MSKKLPFISIVILFCFDSSFGATMTLKPETKSAWDAYLQAAQDNMQARLKPGAKFLWVDEDPARAEHVRTQGPLIGPIGPHIPQKVPSGLIHDWLGAGYLPNLKITDVVSILRDYDHYKDFYKPGVLESAAHGNDGVKDLFSMRLANKSVVSKTALDTECEVSYVRVDDQRWYGLSNSTHIREIDKFGTPAERMLPEDEGTGLIWRLSSITRLEERDGGVYAELEALVLSRDIPGALRLFVTPIVKRVSRDSLATSLHQTKVAIDESMARRKQEAAQ